MLTISNLRVVYGNGNEALKSISLEAQRGEIIAIIGRSGAGKSTLIRCINGLQKPASGKIILDGEEITAMNSHELRLARRQIGFVWQEYNLIDRLTAIRNVLSGRLGYNPGLPSLLGYFGREDRAIAVRNLERVNMLHRATQRADRLSGGEKQRVSIARAISQQPKIMLADEPVASLDPALSWQIMSDLARVAREDNVLTIINIHQIDLAKEFADRMIGIAKGIVIFDGKPAEFDKTAMDRVYMFDDRYNDAHQEQITPASAAAL